MSLYLGDQIISGQTTLVGESRNIGQIIPSAIPLTDAGLHLLDGALIQGSGIYSAFVTYIAGLVSTYPNLFVTESAWQSAVTTYGVCGKFVYNSTNNTVRLPKVTGIIEGTTDVTALGDLVEAGLPVHTHTRGTMNITGGIGSNENSLPWADGAFWLDGYSGKNDYHNSGNTGDVRNTIHFNAASSWTGNTSNPIYTNNIQNSSTVQPQTIKVLYYIVIANSTKTEIQSNIDEIATDLNGKADTDLTNTTNTGYIKMAGAGMPSSTYVDLTLGASGSAYTAPADGWVALSKSSSSANQFLALIDSSNALRTQLQSVANGAWLEIYLPVKKGRKFIAAYTTGGSTNYFRFIYAEGSESEVQ